MFAELQRVRFLNNQADAAGHDGPLPVVIRRTRPVRVRRIMGAEEAGRKQMRVRAVPHCGACQKWGHTSRSKLCALFKKK
jgi:hypothetical protein